MHCSRISQILKTLCSACIRLHALLRVQLPASWNFCWSADIRRMGLSVACLSASPDVSGVMPPGRPFMLTLCTHLQMSHGMTRGCAGWHSGNIFIWACVAQAQFTSFFQTSNLWVQALPWRTVVEELLQQLAHVQKPLPNSSATQPLVLLLSCANEPGGDKGACLVMMPLSDVICIPTISSNDHLLCSLCSTFC